jgi:hypothetical protein
MGLGRVRGCEIEKRGGGYHRGELAVELRLLWVTFCLIDLEKKMGT